MELWIWYNPGGSNLTIIQAVPISILATLTQEVPIIIQAITIQGDQTTIQANTIPEDQTITNLDFVLVGGTQDPNPAVRIITITNPGQCPGQMKCCNGANGMRSCEQPIFYVWSYLLFYLILWINNIKKLLCVFLKSGTEKPIKY